MAADAATSERSDPRAARLWRAFPISLAIFVFAAAAAELVWMSLGRLGREYGAIDIVHYLDATQRWLDSGSPYVAAEIAAPFAFGSETFLHPPLTLYLLLPFTMLPPALWWAIPIAIVCVTIASWRPDRWAWPLIALCLVWPRSPASLIVGNTDMWVAAFLALGLRLGWPAVLIAVKPSFAPLMLAGAGSRSWWLGMALLGLAALPFGQMWGDWLAVIGHAPADLAYSALSLPLALVPVIAWLRRRPGSPVVRQHAPISRTAGLSAWRTAAVRVSVTAPFRRTRR